MNIINRLKADENLHRSTVAIIGHELTDWLIVANVLSWLIITFALPFWFIMIGAVVSVIYGVFQAHWLMEIHDKYDALHRARPRDYSYIQAEEW